MRTEKVVVEEKGGATGATLSIAGGIEISRSLLGTADWTYMAMAFRSGQRTEVEEGGRVVKMSKLAVSTCSIRMTDRRPILTF